MPSTPYMKLYIGDYLGDTQHLSCLEHGAYMLLIMAYWQTGGPITSDPVVLRRITKTSQKEFKNWHENVLKMFEVKDAMLVHKRIDIEIAKRQQVSMASTNAANTRWSERNAGAMPTQCRRNATPIVHSPDSIDNIKQKEKKEDVPPEFSPTSRIEAARLTWNDTPGFPQYRYMAMNIPPDKMSPMLRTLSAYSDAEVVQAIRNYATIKADPALELFPTYPTFAGFMAGGIETYCDEAKPFDRCKPKAKPSQFQKMGALDDRPDAMSAADVQAMRDDMESGDYAEVDFSGILKDHPLGERLK